MKLKSNLFIDSIFFSGMALSLLGSLQKAPFHFLVEISSKQNGKCSTAQFSFYKYEHRNLSGTLVVNAEAYTNFTHSKTCNSEKYAKLSKDFRIYRRAHIARQFNGLFVQMCVHHQE